MTKVVYGAIKNLNWCHFCQQFSFKYWVIGGKAGVIKNNKWYRGNDLFFYFFLDTPTVLPRRPVVLVCWPRTRRLKENEVLLMPCRCAKKQQFGINILPKLKGVVSKLDEITEWDKLPPKGASLCAGGGFYPQLAGRGVSYNINSGN